MSTKAASTRPGSGGSIDGSVPGRAQLEVDQTLENERGIASVVPDGRIHTVEAMDGQQAVSIHVYGTDIVTQQRSEFDPLTGTERVFRPRSRR